MVLGVAGKHANVTLYRSFSAKGNLVHGQYGNIHGVNGHIDHRHDQRFQEQGQTNIAFGILYFTRDEGVTLFPKRRC